MKHDLGFYLVRKLTDENEYLGFLTGRQCSLLFFPKSF